MTCVDKFGVGMAAYWRLYRCIKAVSMLGRAESVTEPSLSAYKRFQHMVHADENCMRIHIDTDE